MGFKHLKSFMENCEDYKGTSWTDNVDGEEVTITISDVEDYMEDEVIEIPVDEIADMCIHKDKKDEATKKRAEASDLKYPIIITEKDGKYEMILDGHHRLQKSINNKENTIKARVLNLDDAPEEYKVIFKK